MALNIFGALGALGRVLPGYVQGERQAVEDNWRDLNEYNRVQAGQYENAFTGATFNPRLSMMTDAANNSRMQNYANMRNDMYSQYAFPMQLNDLILRSQFQPAITGMQNYALFNYWNNMARNPYLGMMGGMGGFGGLLGAMGGMGGYGGLLGAMGGMGGYGGMGTGGASLPSIMQRGF
jgi:hypothetical protein